MKNKVKLLVFSGSARKGSYNKLLAKNAAEIGEKLGAEVTYVDLKDYPMPIYDGDLEEEIGLPENAAKIKKLFLENDGLFLACPEYNSSITPILKNVLDWVSRPQAEDEEHLIAYQDKVVAISGASPGGWGGLRGLEIVRMMLHNMDVMVVPKQIVVPAAYEAFDEEGQFKDKKLLSRLEGVVKQLIDVTGAMKG